MFCDDASDQRVPIRRDNPRPRQIRKKQTNRTYPCRMVIDRTGRLPYATSRAEGRMAAPSGEESPDSLKQRCRVTPGRGNPTESATENNLPWSAMVKVKRWGKSPPGRR